MPAANTEAVNEHLTEIGTQVASSAYAALICDGAGWHEHGTKRKLPDAIALLAVPPSSPELNPTENVWDTREAMLKACEKAWRFLIDDPDRIRSIAHRTSATVKRYARWH
jgi:hypothetical protein